MKLQMKREALEKLERQANEMKSKRPVLARNDAYDEDAIWHSFGTVLAQL
jgi:hypothetical protein